MICPRCVGTRRIRFTGICPDVVEYPCGLCRGTGSIEDGYDMRLQAGMNLRMIREKHDLSAREAARKINTSVLVWTDAETGALAIETVQVLAARLMTAMGAMSEPIAVRFTDGEDPEVDEIVARGVDVHLERLSDSSVWVGITTAAGRVSVRLWTKRQKIEISATEEEK